MKSFLLLLLASALSYEARAQASGYLDVNHAKAYFYSDGKMFRNGNNPGYEWPQGSGHHMNALNGLWIAGRNPSHQLSGAAVGYPLGDHDFFPGPLVTDGSASIDSNTMALYDRVWKVTAEEIQMFRRCNCNNPSDPICAGYTPPPSITEWPGNPIVENDGDHLLMDAQLAPYADVNNDGQYRWQDCDYPVIKCNQALFFVFNDRGGAHEVSGLPSIGLEIRAMAYACGCQQTETVLNDALFIDYEVIHRGTEIIRDVYAAMFSDTDVRGANDDYAGTHVTEGYTYFYNGSGLDGPQITGIQPAQAMIVLGGPWMDSNGNDDGYPIPDSIAALTDTTHISPVFAINGLGFEDGVIDNERMGLTRSMHYVNPGPQATSDPETGNDHYGYMRSFWKNGDRMRFGGDGFMAPGVQNIPAYFAYPGDSDPMWWGTQGTPSLLDWTCINTGGPPNNPADYRMVSASGPFTLDPGERNLLSYGFVSVLSENQQDSTSLDSLHHAVLAVKYRYYNTLMGCEPLMGFQEDLPASLNIYPNPAGETVYITIPPGITEATIRIIDLAGHLICTLPVNAQTQQEIAVDLLRLAPGMYIVALDAAKFTAYGRIIRQ